MGNGENLPQHANHYPALSLIMQHYFTEKLLSGRFQQNVSNLNVIANVKGIICGTNLTGGNIEFWPNNYEPQTQGISPNASSNRYDFDDTMNEPQAGYGSMQVHNHDTSQLRPQN